MYPGMYKTKDKSVFMKVMVVAIISFTVGALVVGGQRVEPPPSGDTDRIDFADSQLYIDADANQIYIDVTGRSFSEDGHLFTRCTMAVYDISGLEVDMINYAIEISDTTTMIYIVRMNETGGAYTVIENFQKSGTIGGQVQLTTEDDIAIIIFYADMCQVTIEVIAYHG